MYATITTYIQTYPNIPQHTQMCINTSEHRATLATFRAYLTQVGYGRTTRQMLPSCVKELLAYYPETYAADFTQKHIEDFFYYLKARPKKRQQKSEVQNKTLSRQMLRHYGYAFRVFFNFLVERGDVIGSPVNTKFDTLTTPKENALLDGGTITRQPLASEETKALFAASRTPLDRAILHVFYSCGLRRSEGVRLSVEDVHLAGQVLYVRQGKGSRRRVVPFTVAVKNDFEDYGAYIMERTFVLPPHDTSTMPFLTGAHGRGLTGGTLLRKVQEMAGRAGMADINRTVTLHDLRHSIATHLLSGGLSVEDIRDFLGHKHLETTQRYVKVSLGQIRDV